MARTRIERRFLALPDSQKAQFLKNHPKFAARHPKAVQRYGGSPAATPNAGTEESTYTDKRGNEVIDIPGVGKRVDNLVTADIATGTAANQATIGQQNANIQTDFGSSTTEVDPGTGEVTYTETMDPGQAGLLEGSQALHEMGTQAAQNAVGNYQQFSGANAGDVPVYQNQAGGVGQFNPTTQQLGQFQGGQGAAGVNNQQIQNYQDFNFDSGDTRQRVEQAAYEKLTRNLERDRQREIDAKKQELYNKGIPFSEDPNSRWQREMGSINQRYDDRELAAGREATILGGQELSRDFGIQQGAHQQGMLDMQAMFNLAKDTTVTQASIDKAQFDLERMTSDQRRVLQQQAFNQGISEAEMLAKLQQQSFNQDAFQHQQGMSDIATLSGVGTGAIMPNLPGYQAPPPVDATSPSNLRLALRELGLTNKEINQALEIAGIQSGTTLGAAQIGADATVTAAQIAADSRREAANKSTNQGVDMGV